MLLALTHNLLEISGRGAEAHRNHLLLHLLHLHLNLMASFVEIST